MKKNPFHQSAIWQKLQESLGIHTVRIDNVLVLIKKLPFNKCFLEVQRGEFSFETWKKIIEYSKSLNAIFCRLSLNTEKPYSFLGKYIKTNAHRFPEMSLIVELKSDEELLSDMNQSGRRHLRKAQKEGIVVEESCNVDDFFNLLEETASRDGFSGHNKDFYQKLLNAGAFLMIARDNEQVLSAGIFAYSGKNCIYLYGVSSSKNRKSQAPTILQWKTMQKAREDFIQYYDFFGIAPKDYKNHPWQGVSQFKRKFGGKEILYYPEIEVPFSKFWYNTYRIARKFK